MGLDLVAPRPKQNTGLANALATKLYMDAKSDTFNKQYSGNIGYRGDGYDASIAGGVSNGLPGLSAANLTLDMLLFLLLNQKYLN